MTASAWNTILTAPELDAHYALTASLDPHFAKGERTFYESRTPTQLRVLAAQAWDCNDPTGYQLARSYARGVTRGSTYLLTHRGLGRE